jgi:hypothetical protein
MKFSRAFQLFRVLIPAWRFFDQKGDVPVLYYRTSVNGLDFSNWKNALALRPQRNIRTLFVNGEGNAFLACHTLIEQLVDDLYEEALPKDSFQESVSFRLVENLVRNRILIQESARPGTSELRFQFKITTPDDLLISEVTKW